MKLAEAKRDAAPRAPRLWAAPQKRGAELQFLPAALGILETPASPVGRAIGATIILFFAIAVGWATFGYVDIIATAPGKILPTGKVKVIQPVEAGVVAAIHVRDGDHVTAGQLLVQIDRTITTAERNRVGHDLLRARLDVARLSALRAALEAGTGPVGFAPPPDAPAYEVARTQAATLAQASEQAAKLKSPEHQIAQKTGERRRTQRQSQSCRLACRWSEIWRRCGARPSPSSSATRSPISRRSCG